VVWVESGGGKTEASGNSVVGGKAAEVGSFATDPSWVVACAIAEPKDVGYIRHGYHHLLPMRLLIESVCPTS
jgi:hypothetical protein